MKILTRYIIKEMLGPTILGFSFYTFIILMKQLFDFAGMIIKRSLPASTIGKLLLLSLPHIVVLTVPMSLLFGILISIGRLSSDSEIIAMRALGISTKTIYRPVFIFSFLVFLISAYLMNVVLPWGNTELNVLKAEIATLSIEKEIRPRVFYEEFADLMLYVNDVDPRTGAWNGVFVADSRGDEESQNTPMTPAKAAAAAARAAQADNPLTPQSTGQRVIVSQTGTLSIVRKPTKQIWLNLTNAYTHIWDPRKPDRYDINKNSGQRMRLPDKLTDAQMQAIRSFREMNVRELAQQARMAEHGDQDVYNMARVEIHKKFAFPFACMVFGILGLPLGITNRRGGKSSGFTLSIAIITGYYVMIINGEKLANAGKIDPITGMWAPNIILFILGIYLLIRANRYAGAQKTDRGWLKSLVALIPKRRARRSDMEVTSPEEPSILNRLDITFPSTIDRYVLREFIKILLLVLLSTAALFVIIDYSDISADLRVNHVPFHIVFAYYRFLLFQILNYTIPISVLVATLVTFGLLSRNNEVTAFKASGISLYRIALPIVVMAAVMSVLSYFMLDFVMPYSNQKVDQLKNQIKGKRTVATGQQQKLWLFGRGRYIINFLSYDRNLKQLSQVQVFEMHPTEWHLTRRVYADRARWDGTGWVFENGWMRSFTGDGSTTVFTPITVPIRLSYAEKPEDFATEVKAPEQMTFQQLRRYIDTIKQSGYAAEELSVKLYQKTSWPFLSLVMTLIALPFAFKIGKRGALYGVGIALVLGIFYWMVFAVFTKFGEVGNLPPLLSAWSANVLFAIAAVYMFLNVET
jgi:LPS export ABC transporter permease LptG